MAEHAGTSRRRFLQAAGLGAAGLALGRRSPGDAGRKRPNVLFLFTDDQREDTVSALGNPDIQTPNLDALVKSGVVFRNAYCMGGFSGAVCLPSRLMTMYGRSWFSVRGLPEDAPCFPRSMNEAGYETYHHGKKGNTARQAHTLFAHSHYLDDGTVRKSGHPGKLVADDAIAFLRERDRDRPLFMYLAFASPHDPRVARQEYLDRYDLSRMPLPANFLPFHPFNNGELVIRDERLAAWPRTEGEIRMHLRDYYAVITYLDEQIGRIIQALKDAGEYDNTIIVFSSDQGIAIGSHGLMGKQNLYEHSMGVPLIFSGPGIPAGRSVGAFAYLFDVYPTVCELVGAPIPESLEGRSLAPIIRGEADSVRDTIFLAYRDIQRAVRRGRWKLIRYPRIDKTQLFDLEADPHETQDLAADPGHAKMVRELKAAMREQQRLFGDPQPLVVAEPEPGEVTLEYFEKVGAGRGK
jgi:arylsulfatase A-like enzyme